MDSYLDFPRTMALPPRFRLTGGGGGRACCLTSQNSLIPPIPPPNSPCQDLNTPYVPLNL